MGLFGSKVTYRCCHAETTGGFRDDCNSLDTLCRHPGIDGSFFVSKWEAPHSCEYMGKENKCPGNRGAKWV